MRLVVLALIAAGAAVMGWLWLQPVCAGGHVIANSADCARMFDAGFCRDAFSRMPAIAARSGTSYVNETECRDAWPICDKREPQGFGPRPSHWCLVRAADGSAARIEPQYNNRRQ